MKKIPGIMACLLTPVVGGYLAFSSPNQLSETEVNKVFDTAWELFVRGDLEKSSEIVDELLRSKLPSKSIRAKFLYLDAYLLGKRRDGGTEAIEKLEMAQDLYREDGSAKGVLFVRKALVKHYLDERRTADAENLLEELFLVESDDSYLHSLQAELHFLNGHYLDALKSAQAGLAKYEKRNDKRGTEQARIQVGLFLMLTGHLEEGLTETFKSQKGVVDLSDTEHYYYSLINTIIYHRCKTGGLPDQPVRLLNARLESQYDKGLDEMLEFATSHACE